jgi:hypothetical protein
LLAGLVAAAQQSATVSNLTGVARIDPGNRPLLVGGVVNQGETVTLEAGAELTLDFPDGSSMDVAGPASFKATLLTDAARTIDLLYGSINRLVVKDIVTGIRTPFGSFVAAQNATVFVGIGETPDNYRSTFMLLEGEGANVVNGNQLMILTKDRPITLDTAREPAPLEPTAGSGEASTTGDSAQLKIGDHTFLITPKDGFTIEPRPDGGFRIVRTGEGTGLINVDDTTQFYMFQGDFMDIGPAGNVEIQSGVIHIYSPLDREGLYNEPISSPAAASATGTKVK